MKIREFETSWKFPKSEIRENLSTRKLPDQQYFCFKIKIKNVSNFHPLEAS